MKTYLVEIESPDYKPDLVAGFEKVGNAESLPNYLIIKTTKPIEIIRQCDGVVMVEEDEKATISEVDQQNPPGWALPWMSNSGGNYENEGTGAGVYIYIIDTGIRDTHADFGGRVRNLYSFDDVPYSLVGGQSPTHGTSVASCAAGTLHGTAKEATIVNCRVDFLNSTILKALDTILRDHLDKPDDIPSILNFSGSSLSHVLGNAFERLTDYGVVIVAAAGNEGEDLPRYPARNTWVTAVGAINRQEGPAWFTNKRCDVYAPGQNILTASVFTDSSTNIISGTSFSAPYYAGLLACLIQGSHKFNTDSLVSDFTHQMRTQMMERNRIQAFPNGGWVVRTVTTNGLGGEYYTSPSSQYSDAEILEYLNAHMHDVQHIADVLKENNISLSRLSRIADMPMDDVNQFFIDAGIDPWWFT